MIFLLQMEINCYEMGLEFDPEYLEELYKIREELRKENG